ncbi:hypothetical protein, partial [Polynucleobacter asymbioticus]|uniref:hypothetical protein n=1 Tax=Polynucleobacter asymbioticus TaxID=576611 RepID=UPI000AF0F122
NLSGSNAVVAGNITGSSSSAVNVLGNFSSGGDIAVGAVNISNTGALTLNNNVNVNTGTGTLTNAGNLIVAASTYTPIITGNYAQSGNYSVGINGLSYGQLHILGNASFTPDAIFSIARGSNLTGSSYSSIVDTTGTIGGFSVYNGIYHYSGLTTEYSVTEVGTSELDLLTTTTGYGQLVFNTSTYTGDVGFASYHNGVLINPGVSVGGRTYGIYINSGGSIDGGITNSGTLVGSSIAGIFIGNNSTLGGTLGGLYGAGIQNLAGSTIVGGQYGIAIQSGGVVTSGITNAGSILGNT